MDKLENVWSVFQNLDEFVYASDIETNELVYLNRKAMDTFGLKSIDEIKGRKCYEVLQGSNLPCALCTNNQLSVGELCGMELLQPRVRPTSDGEGYNGGGSGHREKIPYWDYH